MREAILLACGMQSNPEKAQGAIAVMDRIAVSGGTEVGNAGVALVRGVLATKITPKNKIVMVVTRVMTRAV